MGCHQVTEAFASDQKLELALEENARVFRTLERRRERTAAGERTGGSSGPPQPPPRPVVRPAGVGSQLPPLPPKPPLVPRPVHQVRMG